MSDGCPAAKVTERIVFSGRVQGVGFRFTTRGIARQFPVVGYVRNLADGTVELVVRGSESAVNEVLSRLMQHFRENLRSVARDHIAVDESFSCFEIRH